MQEGAVWYEITGIPLEAQNNKPKQNLFHTDEPHLCRVIDSLIYRNISHFFTQLCEANNFVIMAVRKMAEMCDKKAVIQAMCHQANLIYCFWGH